MMYLPFYNFLHGHGETEAPSTLTGLEEMANTGLTLAGRFLFSAIFVMGGVEHFLHYQQMVGYALSNQVPAAEVLVPLTGGMILLGGLSMLLGFHARLGAWLLVLFLIPTAFLMHHFWDITDPVMASMQMANFMKNIALAGAALLFTRLGSGTGSLTHD